MGGILKKKLVRNVMEWLFCCLFFELAIPSARANFLSFLIPRKRLDYRESKGVHREIIVKPGHPMPGVFKERTSTGTADRAALAISAGIKEKPKGGLLKFIVKPGHPMPEVSKEHTSIHPSSEESTPQLLGMGSENNGQSPGTADSTAPAISAGIKEVSPLERVEIIPPGYEIKNVPGDGLCGYWATLLAVAAVEKHKTGKNIPIHIAKKDVFGLLKRLADRIEHMIGKENRTDKENEMVEEIDQLIRDKYGNSYEALCRKIEAGDVQLDSPLLVFLALEIGYDIDVNWNGRTRDGHTVHDLEQYASGYADAGKIRLDSSGHGSAGHYRAIVPKEISVCFERNF
jgi:hypothetical protein